MVLGMVKKKGPYRLQYTFKFTCVAFDLATFFFLVSPQKFTSDTSWECKMNGHHKFYRAKQPWGSWVAICIYVGALHLHAVATEYKCPPTRTLLSRRPLRISRDWWGLMKKRWHSFLFQLANAQKAEACLVVVREETWAYWNHQHEATNVLLKLAWGVNEGSMEYEQDMREEAGWRGCTTQWRRGV